MTNGNGKNMWLRWTAAIIMSLLLTGITFLGNGVIANDRLSRERDTCLEREIDEVRQKTNEELSQIKEQQAVMLTHLEYIRYGRTNP